LKKIIISFIGFYKLAYEHYLGTAIGTDYEHKRRCKQLGLLTDERLVYI